MKRGSERGMLPRRVSSGTETVVGRNGEVGWVVRSEVGVVA